MKRHMVPVWAVLFTAILMGGLSLPATGQEKPKSEAPAPEMAIARAVVGNGRRKSGAVGVAETFPASTEKVYCSSKRLRLAKTRRSLLSGPRGIRN